MAAEGETTRPTTYLLRFKPLSRPASYIQASKAAGPRRSMHDWTKIKKGKRTTKRVTKHVRTAGTARRPRQGKLKIGRRRTYRATEENKENDPQEGRTTKAIPSNEQRRFEKGKIQTRRGRGLKNRGIPSNC